MNSTAHTEYVLSTSFNRQTITTERFVTLLDILTEWQLNTIEVTK